MRKFGTSGIRGVVGKDVDAELAFDLGANLVKKKGCRVVIGRDTRNTGPMLEQALAAGVANAGGISVSIGIAPTPTTALATKKYGDIGVMITASHNPPEYNGFKLFNSEGEEIGKAEEKAIEEKLNSGEAPQASWDKMGSTAYNSNALYDHLDEIMKEVDVELIKKKNPKVVVDPGNGAASVIMPYALRLAGCQVVAVNTEPTGFFARNLEPNAENLKETREIVKAIGAELGIAHDGDSDRAIVIDENGELVGLDAQLALMCEEVLEEKKGKIVSTIEASLCVKEAVEKAGGELEITRVGSLFVARKMAEANAVFGGEPCGEYIFPDAVPLPDGILTGLKFVEYYCRHGSLAKAKEKISSYPMKRAKYECEDREKAMAAIAPKIKEEFKGSFFEEDGVRVDFDGGWLLVRASGTEPIIRITTENKTQEGLGKVFSKAEEIVKSAV